MFRYPKLLLITSSTFNPYTGTGILLTNLFKGWPLDKIALLHSDHFYHDEDACRLAYMIGSNERRWIWPLSLIDSKSNNSSSSNVANSSVGNPIKVPALARVARRFYSRLVAIAGGEEVFFRMLVSKKLLEWVKEFNPDLIYSHISTLNNINFSLDMQSLTGVPLCIHIMDDWLSVRYRSGIFAPRLRQAYLEKFKELLDRSSLRMGISQQMCRAYEEEFHHPFLPFHNALDLCQWMNRSAAKAPAGNSLQIIYAGTINTKNVNNLVSLSRVVHKLNSRGTGISLRIYTFQPRAEEYRPLLESQPVVSVGEVPDKDMEMAALLASADLLFLPVDFTDISIERMRYSMFAKLPAYMASGTPILAYGPPEVAAIEYAMREKWAYVVPEQDEGALEAATLKLAENASLRERIGHRAQQVAIRDFDANKVRQAFHSALAKAAFGSF